MSSFTRRGALALILGGGSVIFVSTKSFSRIDGSRSADVSVASGENSLIGLVEPGPVQKNQREPMVKIVNNTADSVSVTVSLQVCSEGVLYDNQGDMGCSVTLGIASGSSEYIDIEASSTGSIQYSIDAESASTSIEMTRSVKAESGNKPGAIRIQKPAKNKDFTARVRKNQFETEVDIRDDDGDADLKKIEFKIKEDTTKDVVGSKTIELPPGDQDRYQSNNPSEIITSNSGYSIKPNRTYLLEVEVTDSDGNLVSETVQDTTGGGGPGGGGPGR
jgi:hypothetical protein